MGVLGGGGGLAGEDGGPEVAGGRGEGDVGVDVDIDLQDQAAEGAYCPSPPEVARLATTLRAALG